MPSYCCVRDCKSKESLHRLPTDQMRRAEWITAIGLAEDVAAEVELRVCSRHFNPDTDYKTDRADSHPRRAATPFSAKPLERRELKDTAIPSRNLVRPPIHMDGVKLMRNILKNLDEMVAGQKTAKTRMAGVIAMSAMSRANQAIQEYVNVQLQKSNVMMYGPSGTGKTMLAKCLAQFLDVPAIISDCTTLSRTGYVGRNVEAVVADLLEAANGDVAAAQNGVIFLDEIDSLKAAPEASNGLDVAGKDVQKSLLKLLEGKVVHVTKPGYERRTVPVDTTNIIFVGIGVFPALGKIVAKRMTRMAGGATEAEPGISANMELLPKAKKEDFIEYGMMREFMGRFTDLVPFQPLGVDALVEAMGLPRNSLLEELKLRLTFFKVDASFTRDGKKAIAREALKLGTGARGLRDVFNGIFNAILAKVLVAESPISVVKIIENKTTNGVDIQYGDNSSAMECDCSQ